MERNTVKWAINTETDTLVSSSHLSLSYESRWGTTDDFATSLLHFTSVLHCPLGLGELQACPFPDVVTDVPDVP